MMPKDSVKLTSFLCSWSHQMEKFNMAEQKTVFWSRKTYCPKILVKIKKVMVYLDLWKNLTFRESFMDSTSPNWASFLLCPLKEKPLHSFPTLRGLSVLLSHPRNPSIHQEKLCAEAQDHLDKNGY